MTYSPQNHIAEIMKMAKEIVEEAANYDVVSISGIVTDISAAIQIRLEHNDSELEPDLIRIHQFISDKCSGAVKKEASIETIHQALQDILEELTELVNLYNASLLYNDLLCKEESGNVYFFPDAGGGTRIIRGTNSLG